MRPGEIGPFASGPNIVMELPFDDVPCNLHCVTKVAAVGTPIPPVFVCRSANTSKVGRQES